jgi:hypothetical protein
MRMKKRRFNITLDADAARILTAYAKRQRIPLGRLLQDAAMSVLLKDKAPEVPADARQRWADRLMAMGTPAACRHNNGFRHLKLDLGALQNEIHLGEKFDKTPGGAPVWLVSVRTGGPYGQNLVGTLHYLLPGELADTDSEKVVSPAVPQLHRDLKAIINGQSPEALDKVVPV